MPLYEYRCQSCNRKFEELVFSVEKTVNCPHCASASVEKLLSTFGVATHDPCGGGSCGSPTPDAMCGTQACPCRHA